MKKLLSFFAIVISMYSFAADYYWVGGSGNWNDINHWRTSSGGTGVPSVIPGPTDNVFFDANSGFTTSSKTVTLNTTGNCNNIIFFGSSVAPTFTENGSQTLNIYGSSEWQTGMPAINISTIFYRNTNTPKTIKSNGVTIGLISNIITNFEEKSSITLLDNFRINGNVNLREGTFNTNNYDFTIVFRFNASNAATNTKLILGSSNVYLENTNPAFNTDSSNLTVDAGTSHIIFETMNSSSGGGFSYYNNQVFNNVSFLGTLGYMSGNGKFNKVFFLNDGTIKGNNQYNELTFSPSKVYSLESGKTQKIITKFSALTPQCGGWSTIKSNQAGTQASIEALNTATIELSGVVMKDIYGIGSANFTASNSVDNGNNSGWLFPPAVGENLYWVGGAGNWNDRLHWSDTSGGSGGYCIPGPNNNTFFDINSGFTTNSKSVNIDNLSYTKNITFSGSAIAPELNQIGTQEFNIYGSSEWQTGMPAINISTIFYRNTNTPKTIKSNGVTIGLISNIITNFEEKSSITLLDNFRINGNVNLREGTFNTNNYDFRIVFRFNASNAATNTKLILGSSNVYLENTNPAFNTDSSNLTVDAGTSHIIFETMNSTSGGGFSYYNNQVFNNVSFLGTLGYMSGNGKFNKVFFLNDGTIKGNNQYNELTFSPSKVYSLESGKTQKIITKFSALTPQCGGWSTIKSNQAGTQASIEALNTATIELSGVVMKDIYGIGSANFTASNSVDNGNNSGWLFPPAVGEDLYWVGGAGNWNDRLHWSDTSGGNGGYCIPGPNNNTFFDINSGFTTNSKSVNIDNLSYTKNITFSGSAIAPELNQIGTQEFNIYGSSEWQTGMPAINISTIFYRNTNTPKTIKSNGVTIGLTSNIITNFEEKSSITLLDNFRINGNVNLREGTFNTNNYDFRIVFRFNASNAATNTKLILGNSNVYLENTVPVFNTNSSNLAVDAGTSHIIFETMSSSNGGGFSYYNNQVFNNVSFLGTLGYMYGNGKFNKVFFLNDGTINGNNQYNELTFSAGKTYSFKENATQTIDYLVLGGTPCEVTFLKSSIAGTKTNINVTGTTRNFNFANLKDINATNTLHFGETSTIDNQNNNNITFDPYNPGSFSGFNGDRICPTFTNTEDYFITTEGFYGNPNTTYKWYKTGGENANLNTIISTDPEIDLRIFGYGRYKVIVNYSAICILEEEITIKDCPAKINPNIRIKVK